MEKDRKISRRTFLAAASGTLVSIGLPGTFILLADAAQRDLAASTRPDGRPSLVNRFIMSRSSLNELITWNELITRNEVVAR